jgi:FKBP-type peptidyl-prolyl cis-trans isomerase FkpA
LHAVTRAALLATLLVTACSSEDASVSGTTTIETVSFAPSLNVDLASSLKLPSGMYIKDLTIGTGAAVVAGQTLSMRYTGWLPNGTQFDATGNGAPFQFRLGAGPVIQGWDLGVAGMKVGGKRQLIITPALGYGAAGVGPIPGNSILVFTVEVVAAQ